MLNVFTLMKNFECWKIQLISAVVKENWNVVNNDNVQMVVTGFSIFFFLPFSQEEG
jgi:hypothetical protein